MKNFTNIFIALMLLSSVSLQAMKRHANEQRLADNKRQCTKQEKREPEVRICTQEEDTKNHVKLQSSDDVIFVIDRAMAAKSSTLGNFIEDLDTNQEIIPLGIDSNTLGVLISSMQDINNMPEILRFLGPKRLAELTEAYIFLDAQGEWSNLSVMLSAESARLSKKYCRRIIAYDALLRMRLENEANKDIMTAFLEKQGCQLF